MAKLIKNVGASLSESSAAKFVYARRSPAPLLAPSTPASNFKFSQVVTLALWAHEDGPLNRPGEGRGALPSLRMGALTPVVCASLAGARTHDEDDTMMKQKGATGVFRNLAFADADDNLVSTSARAMATSESTKKNNFFGGSQDNIASIE